MEFIENISETQSEYNLELKEKNWDVVLEASIFKPDNENRFSYIKRFFQNLVYNTKLNVGEFKHIKDKDDNNIHIIYNKNNKLRELHIYTFNLTNHDYKSYPFNKLVEKESNNDQNTSNENVKLIEKFKLFGMIYENLSVDIDRKLDASTQNWNL